MISCDTRIFIIKIIEIEEFILKISHIYKNNIFIKLALKK